MLLVPLSEPPSAQVLEIVIEDPQLQPAYTTCPDSYWYPFTNNRGHTAYLTLNAFNPANSTNHGEWHPVITQSGYYKVEAYIAAHSAITWCTGQGRTINHDTADAHYSIHHAEGVSTAALSQYPLSNQWLNLGEYYFNAGGDGYVSLTDKNDEPDFSNTVSFSAMRFTFTRLNRPNTYLPMVNYDIPPVDPPPGTGIIQAQGFDACHLPEISEMQTWWNQSPYHFYALYLGGESLYSGCTVANSSWVSAVHQQGWSFVPTWVGPQAPCASYLHKMSNDPAVSYQQGRQNAEAASAKAASIGLSDPDDGGTVIYYDVEVYGGASLECRQVVSSFMNGWVARLHELGNFAGGYGGRNSFVTDWATIAHVPDDVWAASWYTTVYDPNANVFGITWLNGFWGNHQRIRQYSGDHNETWGSIRFNIDSDVADGVVALPPTGPLAIPMVNTAPSIENAGWISADQGWVISENQLYWTDDQGNTWKHISPGSVQLAYFLPSGEAWALTGQENENMILYLSSSMGEKWENQQIKLPPDLWRPIQLQFTSPTNGWIVLKKSTSQAFNIGILMKTSDGGITWTTNDLPIAAPINFLSDEDGWMASDSDNPVYHTLDGGLTWQTEKYNDYPLSILSVPKNATLSGWQANGLGWAVISDGNCTGDKDAPGFTCQTTTSLHQSLDGGQSWQKIPLPGDPSIGQ